MTFIPEPAPDTSWVRTTCGNCGDGKHWHGYCHPIQTFSFLGLLWAGWVAMAVLFISAVF